MSGASQLFTHWARKNWNQKRIGFIFHMTYYSSRLLIAPWSPELRKILRISWRHVKNIVVDGGKVCGGYKSGGTYAMFSPCP